jgi:hypothetical protein
MTPDQLFTLASNLAMAGWIVLLFLPFWKDRTKYVLGIPVVLLAILYSLLIFSVADRETLGNFGSLDGVSKLFTNKTMLLAGWVHYLAFDLFAGVYIVRNARSHAINHWITTPTLALTFLLGPFGLLLYTLLRTIRTKRYLADEPQRAQELK